MQINKQTDLQMAAKSTFTRPVGPLYIRAIGNRRVTSDKLSVSHLHADPCTP